MESITKKDFIEEAKDMGIYFFTSIWTGDADHLDSIEKYIDHIKDVEKYKKPEEFRKATNGFMNMKFYKKDGTFSFLDIGDVKDISVTTIYVHRWFFIVKTEYIDRKTTTESKNKYCLVLYLMKDAKNDRKLKIDPDKFISFLPSGSGIDCDWEYKMLQNGNLQIKNSFHAMNEYGSYDGYMPFRFTVYFDSVKNQFDFDKIICNENRRKSFYGLKEYLEDTLNFYVSNINPGRVEGETDDH